MFTRAGVTVVSVSVLLLSACKSPEQKAVEQAAKQLEEASKQMEAATQNGQANIGDAMNAMATALNGANNGREVETVDYKILKDMLPASLGSLKRTDATGEKSAAIGMQVSHAEGHYSDEQGNANITLKITDIGSMTGLAGMATYAWAMADMDRESSSGYEKTANFNGYKSHEKWDNSTKSGEISVLIGDRFVAEVNGDGVGMNALKDALSKINLKKLDSMKDEGVR